MGGCQNYGPFVGPYYNTGPNTGILTTSHIPHKTRILVQGLGCRVAWGLGFRVYGCLWVSGLGLRLV